MASPFTYQTLDHELYEPGYGGKPPEDERPTGGGGGGGDDEWESDRGPRSLLYRVRFYLFAVLAGDLLLATAVASYWLARQTTLHFSLKTLQPLLWHQLLTDPLFYVNLLILVLSSLTVELARRNIFREIDVLEEWLGLGKPALARALPWLGATLLLGGVFLTGQRILWQHLAQRGLAVHPLADTASAGYALLTGLHGAHMLVGMSALLLGLGTLRLFRRVELRQVAIDAAACYWHTLNLAWMALLTLLIVRPQ